MGEGEKGGPWSLAARGTRLQFIQHPYRGEIFLVRLLCIQAVVLDENQSSTYPSRLASQATNPVIQNTAVQNIDQISFGSQQATNL
jgi:hypothetical protein